MLPSQYEALPRREKAMIIAMIQIKMEDDKKKLDHYICGSVTAQKQKMHTIFVRAYLTVTKQQTYREECN